MPPFKESQPSVPPQASAPQASVNPEVPSQEDARWDIDKAETVGKATHQDAYGRRSNPFTPLPPFDIVLYKDKHYAYEPQELEELEEKARGRYAIEIKELTARRAAEVADLQYPFETLYDLRPEKAAQMPLEEFIKAGREFSSLETNFQIAKAIVSNMEDLRTNLETCIKNRRFSIGLFSRSSGDSSYEFSSLLIGTFDFYYDDEFKKLPKIESIYDEVFEKTASIATDFDRTPRQVTEEYIKIVDQYLTYAREYVEEKEVKIKVFLEKWRVSDSAQEALSA